MRTNFSFLRRFRSRIGLQWLQKAASFFNHFVAWPFGTTKRKSRDRYVCCTQEYCRFKVKYSQCLQLGYEVRVFCDRKATLSVLKSLKCTANKLTEKCCFLLHCFTLIHCAAIWLLASWPRLQYKWIGIGTGSGAHAPHTWIMHR